MYTREDFPEYLLGDEELTFLSNTLEDKTDQSARRIYGIIIALQAQLQHHRDTFGRRNVGEVDHVVLSAQHSGHIQDCQFCFDNVGVNEAATDYEVRSPAIPFRGSTPKLLAPCCEPCAAKLKGQ